MKLFKQRMKVTVVFKYGPKYLSKLEFVKSCQKGKINDWIARIAQLVKIWIWNLRIAGLSLTAGGVLFWYRPLALQIASVGSDHHAKKMEVPTSGL